MLIVGLFVLAMPIYWSAIIHQIRTKSFIYLTDNEIVVKVWGRREKTFPINEIEAVEIVDFDKDVVDKRMKYYTLPVSFGRGGDIIPNRGVLVFFKKKWIKSVHPVFFNPADSERFANALNELSAANNINAR